MADAGRVLREGVEDQEAAEGFYAGLASMRMLLFVGMVRADLAARKFDVGRVLSHQRFKEVLASVWMDAFLLGAVFQELGGHREAGSS